jgi:hypothetical protein
VITGVVLESNNRHRTGPRDLDDSLSTRLARASWVLSLDRLHVVAYNLIRLANLFSPRELLA